MTVAAKEESSALYPVTEGKLTELVIYMPGRDFGSAAVFLGPECIVQLLQMGSVSARTCLFEHSIFRESSALTRGRCRARRLLCSGHWSWGQGMACIHALLGEASLARPTQRKG